MLDKTPRIKSHIETIKFQLREGPLDDDNKTHGGARRHITDQGPLGDLSRQAIQFAKDHPAAVAGVGLGLLAIIGPVKAAKLAIRGAAMATTAAGIAKSLR